MKALLLVFVFLLGVWLWRSRRPTQPKSGSTKPSAQPLDMVSCAWCSVHLPAAEAIKGKKGTYCSADHLARAEQQD